MKDFDSSMPEQGCLRDCFYCKIYPEAKEKCPYCKGAGRYFQEAQMMSRESSEQQILSALAQFLSLARERDWLSFSSWKEEEIPQIKSHLLSLINQMDLYHFDLKDLLVHWIYALDQQIKGEEKP